MASATRTIRIDRPPDQVFGYFANHANDTGWRPAVLQIDPVDGGAVGSRIRQTVKGPGGRGVGADIEVTANEPPTRYAFQVVAGPVRPRGEFRFTPAGDGTDVQMSLDADLGFLKGLLMGGMVQGSMDAEMAALDTAKQAIEGR
ncbi:MAG TPA: SRPBCC family protein [Candidatus Limnocylindrales bacterium]|nr:SRPBCC family protein [Candidatus Limnocylindrales bacterium]